MSTYKLLQWNPHFEVTVNKECAALLPVAARDLASGLDFASIIEDERAAGSAKLFPDMVKLSHKCTKDVIDLYFNPTKYKLATEDPRSWCMLGQDRAATIGVFKEGEKLGQVCVVAAHFPHPQNGLDQNLLPFAEVRQKLKDLDCARTIVMADTNIQAEVSGEDIRRALDLPDGGEYVYENSCCGNNGFALNYDRMFSSKHGRFKNLNMGDPTYNTMRACLEKISPNEFHKPLLASLTF